MSLSQQTEPRIRDEARVIYTNRMCLRVFGLWSETTHLVAIYNIYIAHDATRGVRAETKAQATQSRTMGPALMCKLDLSFHPQRRHVSGVCFL